MARVPGWLLNFCPLLLASCLSATSASTSAATPLGFDWHGFVSQGLAYSTDNSFFSEPDHLSDEFTEIGLNLSSRLNSNLRVSAQALYRNVGLSTDAGLEIDYALIDYTVQANTDRQLGIRLGRYKVPFGLYNETRDVAFTRPSVLLPQATYFDPMRDFVISADGANAYGNHHFNLGDISWDLAYATKRDLNDSTRNFFTHGLGRQGELESNVAWVGRLRYQSPARQWELSITHAELDFDYQAGVGDLIGNGHIDNQVTLFSSQWQGEKWQFAAEFLQGKPEYKAFGPLLDNRTPSTQTYYYQLSRQLNQAFSLTARYERGFADKDDRYGKDAAVLTGLPSALYYYRSQMLGFKWDINDNWMLAGDAYRMEGSYPLSDVDPLNISKHWNFYTLLLSFRF